MATNQTPRINPRDRKPGERRPLGGRPTFSIWWVLGTLLLLAIVQAWFLAPAGQSIPYSEFKALMRGGQVAEVTVGDTIISGRLKQPRGEGRNASTQFTSTRIEDPKLVEELEAHQVKYTGEVVSRWLPEILGWIIPLVLLVAVWSFFFRRMSGAEGGVMSFARSKAKIYAEDDVKVSFSDVAGVDEAEEELKEIVEFLRNPRKYTNLGGRIPKGVLLVGPPGTGKTLLARAVAGEAKVPFFSLSGSEFVEMFVGVGAARVRDLFAQAEGKAPCIVFIDELDALGKMRVQSPMGSHEEREQTLNQLLAEMDGFDARKAVIIMGATNRPEVLDPALLRPGRFDRQVLVDKPDINGREQVLKIHTRNVKMVAEMDLRVIAGRTAGFAGADLANLVNEAALLAARKDKTAVDMRDFDEAIDRLIAGLEKKRVMNAKEREIVAYHESGHAIVASSLAGLDPVHKISIVQRGFGALGYTMQLPFEDRYLMTRTDLLNQLVGAAGGADRGRDRARRNLHRRAERPAARKRHRPGDGDRVRDERLGGRHQLRPAEAKPVPRRRDAERHRALRRRDCTADRPRGEADGRRVTRGRPPHPQRAPSDARGGHPTAAGEGSDGRRRAPRDHGGDGRDAGNGDAC